MFLQVLTKPLIKVVLLLKYLTGTLQLTEQILHLMEVPQPLIFVETLRRIPVGLPHKLLHLLLRVFLRPLTRQHHPASRGLLLLLHNADAVSVLDELLVLIVLHKLNLRALIHLGLIEQTELPGGQGLSDEAALELSLLQLLIEVLLRLHLISVQLSGELELVLLEGVLAFALAVEEALEAGHVGQDALQLLDLFLLKFVSVGQVLWGLL